MTKIEVGREKGSQGSKEGGWRGRKRGYKDREDLRNITINVIFSCSYGKYYFLRMEFGGSGNEIIPIFWIYSNQTISFYTQ